MNFGPTIFYGVAGALAFLCALASRRQTAVWVAMVLLADWLYWNIAIIGFGFAHAPLVLPLGDAMFLGFTVWIWLDARPRNDAVAMVAYLYLVAILAWGTFGLTGTQNGYLCYLTANLIFLLQLVVLGASSAWRPLSDRMDRLSRLGSVRAARRLLARWFHGLGATPRPNGS